MANRAHLPQCEEVPLVLDLGVRVEVTFDFPFRCQCPGSQLSIHDLHPQLTREELESTGRGDFEEVIDCPPSGRASRGVESEDIRHDSPQNDDDDDEDDDRNNNNDFQQPDEFNPLHDFDTGNDSNLADMAGSEDEQVYDFSEYDIEEGGQDQAGEAEGRPFTREEWQKTSPAFQSLMSGIVDYYLGVNMFKPEEELPADALSRAASKLNSIPFLFTPEGLKDLQILTSNTNFMRRHAYSKWTTLCIAVDPVDLPEQVVPFGEEPKSLAQVSGADEDLAAVLDRIPQLNQIEFSAYRHTLRPPRRVHPTDHYYIGPTRLLAAMFSTTLRAMMKSTARVRCLSAHFFSFSPVFAVQYGFQDDAFALDLSYDSLPNDADGVPAALKNLEVLELSVDVGMYHPDTLPPPDRWMPNLRSLLNMCTNLRSFSLSARPFNTAIRGAREAVASTLLKSLVGDHRGLRFQKLEYLDFIQVASTPRVLQQIVGSLPALKSLSIRRVTLFEDTKPEADMTGTRKVPRPIASFHSRSVRSAGVVTADGQVATDDIIAGATRVLPPAPAGTCEDKLLLELVNSPEVGRLTGLRIDRVGQVRFLAPEAMIAHCQHGSPGTVWLADPDADLMCTISNLPEMDRSDEFTPEGGWGSAPPPPKPSVLTRLKFVDQTSTSGPLVLASAAARSGDHGPAEISFKYGHAFPPRFPLAKLVTEINRRAVEFQSESRIFCRGKQVQLAVSSESPPAGYSTVLTGMDTPDPPQAGESGGAGIFQRLLEEIHRRVDFVPHDLPPNETD